MKKIILFFVFCLISANAFAKTTYIYTDKHFNYVKITEMKKKDVVEKKANHPVELSEDKMRAILKEIKLSRSFTLKKETETQDIFDERSIKFLAPKLVEAFFQAKSSDLIVFSYLTKEPQFMFRNDRLTIANAWVTGNELHIVFEKLLAKLSGDYDKRSDFSKIISQSTGLRVSLEVRDGQKYGSDMSELIVDLNHDFTKEASATSDVPESAGAVTGPKKIDTTVAEKPKTTRERLKELDDLKQDGLVTDKEYKAKKQDILKGL